ncbi:hypothetical protein, partial [Chloroflexus sp.]|uniref:hypothetical protein n=1 Tax=Chloroflexus sp. TaxID=1904827 RepID=UPI002ACEC858
PGQAEESGPLLQYPPEPPAPTIGPNPTVPAGLAAGPRFVADFTAADSLNGWHIVDLDFIMPEDRANWIVADGRLQQHFAGEFNDSRPFQTVALAPGEYADATVRVSFYDAFNGVAGLVARYQGAVGYEASYYRLRLLKNEYEATPKYVLEKVVDGVATPLATLEGPGFAPRHWHVIELDVRGGALVARLNGKVLLQATDPQPLPAGRVGVYSRALGGMMFDDFLVAP